MKFIKAILAAAAVAFIGGCAVYPAGGYYGPPRAAYYQPAPVVGVGVYGGWHERRDYH
jgi:hypothetical protein